MTAGMAVWGIRGCIVALMMVMHGAVMCGIHLCGMRMPVTADGMSVGAGDHRRVSRHTLQWQRNQQYRNQQCT